MPCTNYSAVVTTIDNAAPSGLPYHFTSSINKTAPPKNGKVFFGEKSLTITWNQSYFCTNVPGDGRPVHPAAYVITVTAGASKREAKVPSGDSDQLSYVWSDKTMAGAQYSVRIASNETNAEALEFVENAPDAKPKYGLWCWVILGIALLLIFCIFCGVLWLRRSPNGAVNLNWYKMDFGVEPIRGDLDKLFRFLLFTCAGWFTTMKLFSQKHYVCNNRLHCYTVFSGEIANFAGPKLHIFINLNTHIIVWLVVTISLTSTASVNDDSKPIDSVKS